MYKYLTNTLKIIFFTLSLIHFPKYVWNEPKDPFFWDGGSTTYSMICQLDFIWILITKKKAILCRFKWKDWSYSKQTQINQTSPQQILPCQHPWYFYFLHLCKPSFPSMQIANKHRGLTFIQRLHQIIITFVKHVLRWDLPTAVESSSLDYEKDEHFTVFLIGWTNQNSSLCTVTFTIDSYIVTKKFQEDYLADFMHYHRIQTAQKG